MAQDKKVYGVDIPTPTPIKADGKKSAIQPTHTDEGGIRAGTKRDWGWKKEKK